VDGLRVIDASIRPKLISGNTMAAATMIGEKGGADHIRRGLYVGNALAQTLPPFRRPVRQAVRSSGGMRVGLDGICAAGGGGPGEGAGRWLVELPPGVLFQFVVIAAQATQG
jgi:GMC oxidoreductase